MNYYAPHKTAARSAALAKKRKPAPIPSQPRERGRTREQMDEGRCYAGC